MANRVFTRGMRQRKHWHGSSNNTVDFTADATAILGSFTFDQDSATILRTLGRVLMVTNGTIAGSDRARVTLGLGLVTADAFAVGASPPAAHSGRHSYTWSSRLEESQLSTMAPRSTDLHACVYSPTRNRNDDCTVNGGAPATSSY